MESFPIQGYPSKESIYSFSGRVPLVQVGPMIVSEFDPIVAFVEAKVTLFSNFYWFATKFLTAVGLLSYMDFVYTLQGHRLSEQLPESQRAEMKAYITLVENVIVNAEVNCVSHIQKKEILLLNYFLSHTFHAWRRLWFHKLSPLL